MGSNPTCQAGAIPIAIQATPACAQRMAQSILSFTDLTDYNTYVVYDRKKRVPMTSRQITIFAMITMGLYAFACFEAAALGLMLIPGTEANVLGFDLSAPASGRPSLVHMGAITFSIFFFELATWEWRRRDQPRTLRRLGRNIFTTILLNSDLLLTFIASIISLLYISQVTIEIFLRATQGQIVFPGRIIAIFIVYFIYLLIKQPITRLQQTFSPKLSPLEAGYTALGSSVQIDLGLGRELGFSLPYSQIEEIRLMTPTQVRQYLDLEIAPEFKEALRDRTVIQAFLNGELRRPKAFLVGVKRDQGTIVLLRGEDFLYLLNFGDQDGEDLLLAYESYKTEREEANSG